MAQVEYSGVCYSDISIAVDVMRASYSAAYIVNSVTVDSVLGKVDWNLTSKTSGASSVQSNLVSLYCSQVTSSRILDKYAFQDVVFAAALGFCLLFGLISGFKH